MRIPGDVASQSYFHEPFPAQSDHMSKNQLTLICRLHINVLFARTPNILDAMSLKKQGIPPEDFYGEISAEQYEIESILKKSIEYEPPQLPKSMTGLRGPSTTWKIFKKQQDAINCCLERRNGLMPFAFEDVNARRMFLAAHPKVFWGLNHDRFFKNCNSYEIIREYSACKLYLDIEYEYAYNEGKDGGRMLDNLLILINYNLKTFFNITCSRNDVLDLDSNSDTKYSHHVIYEMENVAFQDNYAVGNFLKMVCGELKEAFESNSLGNKGKLAEMSVKYSIPESDILELFVCNHRGETKLVIDEGVYTKNRHFRLLGSSKRLKNVPLRLSSSNKYRPTTDSDLSYFLDSLVTYFSWKVDRVLEFGGTGALRQVQKHRHLDLKGGAEKSGSGGGSGGDSGGDSGGGPIYPQVDSFIRRLISPGGRIRRKVFFGDSSTVVYDIQDFRYCQNVGREHKSNNIKYIVDLSSLKFYQKCYDPDCADFRSEMKPLPEEICFLFEDDSFLVSSSGDFPAEECEKATEEMEFEVDFEESISDEDLVSVAVSAEAVLD